MNIVCSSSAVFTPGEKAESVLDVASFYNLSEYLRAGGEGGNIG